MKTILLTTFLKRYGVLVKFSRHLE